MLVWEENNGRCREKKSKTANVRSLLKPVSPHQIVQSGKELVHKSVAKGRVLEVFSKKTLQNRAM